MFIKIATTVVATVLVGAGLWAGSQGHLDPALSALAEIRAGVVAQSEAGTGATQPSSGDETSADVDAAVDAELDLEGNLKGSAEAGGGDS